MGSPVVATVDARGFQHTCADVLMALMSCEMETLLVEEDHTPVLPEFEQVGEDYASTLTQIQDAHLIRSFFREAAQSLRNRLIRLWYGMPFSADNSLK